VKSIAYRGGAIMEHAAETVELGRTGLRVSALGVGTNIWGSRAGPDPDKRATLDMKGMMNISLGKDYSIPYDILRSFLEELLVMIEEYPFFAKGREH
jgi:hypothetical protein